MSESLLAWHFLPKNKHLRYGRPPVLVRPGQTLRRDPGKLEMCEYGLHASVRPLDALNHAPGPIVCRVRLGGEIIHGDDKCVASRRTVLWMADADKCLRPFACWCVRNTPLADGRVVWDLLTDKRSRRAVEVAERYARGRATKKELDAARDAAWDAARAAAWDAARAAARAAAWDAAWAAAWDAAMDAAMDAAWDAARAAAWDAARAAAWDAARAAQNIRLEEMLMGLAP